MPNASWKKPACWKSSFPPLPDIPAGQAVPVQIEAVVTELGTLELWMKHTNSDRRWKIEFQVRTE